MASRPARVFSARRIRLNRLLIIVGHRIAGCAQGGDVVAFYPDPVEKLRWREAGQIGLLRHSEVGAVLRLKTKEADGRSRRCPRLPSNTFLSTYATLRVGGKDA